MRFVEEDNQAVHEVEVHDVVLAGYTGRDQAAVQRHVAELAAHGVQAPARVPAYFRVSPDRVVTSERIIVLGHETSGEAEFVLLSDGRDLLVGVASDHTDRALERLDVAKSKQLCHKVVSREVWRYEDVRSHWDHIVLRAYADRQPRPYQEDLVTSLMDPDDILAGVRARTDGSLEGVLVFSGTLALVADIEYASHFAVELIDELHGHALRCAYRIEAIEPLD